MRKKVGKYRQAIVIAQRENIAYHTKDELFGELNNHYFHWCNHAKCWAEF